MVKIASLMLAALGLFASLLAPSMPAAPLATALATSSDADQDQSLQKADDLYVRHDYKQALALAEKVLASSPAEEGLRKAQRLKALSLCMLHDKDGYAYAEQIIAECESFAQSAELRLAMGDDRLNRGDQRRAYECFLKAADLYVAQQNDIEAAQALLKAAEVAKSGNDVLPAQQKAENWQDKQRIGIDLAIEIYDRVVGLAQASELRKAQALLLAGQAARSEGTWPYAEKALGYLQRAVEEFSITYQAVEAQMARGEIYEQFNRFVEAATEYSRVITHFADPKLAAQAKARIDGIKRPALDIMVTKPYLPGEKAAIYWRVRNIKLIKLEAYRVDLPAALGGMDQADDSRSVMDVIAAAKGALAQEWNFATGDEGKHEYYARLPEEEPAVAQTTSPIDVPFSEAGAYLVEARGVNPDNQPASSRCLLIFSDIAAVAKADADQVLVLVARAAGGEPVEGANVAVFRRYDSTRKCQSIETNDAGVAQADVPASRSYGWLAAVKKDQQQAICAGGSYYWSWWGYSRKIMVYGFTERPVYRPGQTVSFKQIVRRHEEGAYANLPDTKVGIEIIDPKGQTVYAHDLVTDKFGAVAGSLPIKPDAPLGLYQINVSVDGEKRGFWQSQGNRFRVEEYKKPEFKVTVEPGQGDYRVGDEMRINISAQYYFGEPVAGAEVSFTVRKQSYTRSYEPPHPWPWLRDELGGRAMRGRGYWPQFDEHVASGQATTDEQGHAVITVKADPIKDHPELDLRFIVEATVTDASRRVIRGGGDVKVTHAPFFIYPTPAQAVYGPGDSVEINVKTEDPNGKPVAGQFAVEVWTVQRLAKAMEREGRHWTEYQEKLQQQVFTGRVEVPSTGRASFRFTPDVTGNLRVIVKQASPPAASRQADPPAASTQAETDEGRKPVEGACEVWIASKTGAEAHYAYSDLKIIPASDQYEIGQTMKVLINTAKTDSRVLLTAEAEDLLFWQIVHVPANSKLVEIKIDQKLTPNFELTATLIRDNTVYRDSKRIVVPPTHKFIKVEATMAPGSMGGGGDDDAPRYQPREKMAVRVKLTDVQTGKPVVGQVAAMLVDSSVYYIQPEFREAIEKAFYGYVRQVCVGTIDSFAGPASLNEPGRFYPQEARTIRRMAGMPMPMAADRAVAGQAMELAAKAAPAPGAGPPEEPLVEPVVREEFRDTVLWAGSVVTDADGTAEIPVTLPDQLTTFALHVISFDQDTRVGEGQGEVVTAKRVIVRLEPGRFFTEGDRGYVTVIAHNYYDAPQDLKVDLTASDEVKLQKVNLAGAWQDYASGDPLSVTVPADGEVRLDFLTEAVRPGEVTLLARALGAKESDALQLKVPVVEWGARKIESSGGALRGPEQAESTWAFAVPERIKSSSQTLTITLNPSIAAVALDSLPYLAGYPYGCVEQTMSRFLPTVVMRKTLQDAGMNLDDVRKLVEQQAASDPKLAARYELIRERMGRNPVYSDAEVARMIQAGIDRLADMQHGDGGWGWWKGDQSDPYMTAYVAYGLSVARDCDVKLPGGMLDRAAKFLIGQASQPRSDEQHNWWLRHMDNDNTRAYMLCVIGRLDAKSLADAKLAAHLDRIYAGRDDLTDYGRAYLALALHAAGKAEQAKIVVENFDNTAAVDAKTQSAHWGQTSGWWYWYDGGAETTAWVMQAMMAVSPDDKYIPMAVNWLVANRQELAWGNTKTTATAVLALARYARSAGELDCDQTFEVVIDDAARHQVRVTRENLFTFDGRIEVAADQLPPGPHTVRIARNGKGNLYWGAYLRYFTTAERIAGGGSKMAIARKYYRLVPEEFTNTRKVWKEGGYVDEQFPDTRYNRQPLEFGAEIASGQMIDVELTIDAENNLEYVVFEDPKPAGCEPYRLTSGASYEGGAYANLELRDTKVAFFATHLGQGKSTLGYRLVCERPGTFGVLPSAGEAMYSPFVEAISDSGKLNITPKAERQVSSDQLPK